MNRPKIKYNIMIYGIFNKMELFHFSLLNESRIIIKHFVCKGEDVGIILCHVIFYSL